jgi:hypothetical protein
MSARPSARKRPRNLSPTTTLNVMNSNSNSGMNSNSNSGIMSPPLKRAKPIQELNSRSNIGSSPIKTPKTTRQAMKSFIDRPGVGGTKRVANVNNTQFLAAQSAARLRSVKATPVKATPVKATPVKATPVKATPVKATPGKKVKKEKKEKSVRLKPDQASKTAKSITVASARATAKAINQRTVLSRRQQVAKKPMMNLRDLLDIYQLYLAIVNQRHVILGSDISSGLSDDQVNKVFVDKMEIQLKGVRNANKFSNFLRLMNYVCRVGRATSHLLLFTESSNTERVVVNSYVLKNEKQNPLTYGSLRGDLSRRRTAKNGTSWPDSKAKLQTLTRRGVRWLSIPSFVEFQNESNKSTLDGEVFVERPMFMKRFREKYFNETFKSLIETFKETNDFLRKLENMLKSDDFEHKQLRQLFKASNMPTNNSLKILELMRTRGRYRDGPRVGKLFHPKNMVNATGLGPRHHVQSQAMLSHYLGSDEVKSSTYTGRPLSLPSVLYFADAMLLRKNDMTFSRSPSTGKHNFRGKGDKVIIRQEPALLMPPVDLQNYFYEINRCNTAWRHGGIHCGLENAGYNKRGEHGKTRKNVIVNTNSMIEKMIEAYTLNKSAFDYSEMYTLLDKSRYEAMYFDSKGVPQKIQNDGDENIDGNYFFHNFRYIFKEGVAEIDVLKLLAKSFKSNNTKKLDFKKTFALQTTRRNMTVLLNRLYKDPAVKIAGSVDNVMKIVEKLSRTYSKGLDKQELDIIRNLLNEGQRSNSSASRKLINARANIWKELGLK